jgi:uncharacterized protein
MVHLPAMLARSAHVRRIRDLLSEFPVVGLIGARQIGKTTLAAAVAENEPTSVHFDLEDPRDLAKLNAPMLALEPLRGLVVLDEVQHRPELFPVLRVLADRRAKPARFLVLGSASPNLLRQSSESLAGRIAYHELPGLDLSEVGSERVQRLWLRGGFPRSFVAGSEDASFRWRLEFVRTYLERDLSALGIALPAATMRRFWNMLAHYHGQLWNGAELARAFGVSEKTVRRYLDILESTFMARRLGPWHENLGKRQVKAPKVYVGDTGLLHALLGLESREALSGHPKVGASWEGFAIAEVARRLGARADECFFWRVHTGAELDLLVVRGSKRRGFEIKYTDAPSVTPSMRTAMTDLRLQGIDVVHAGTETFPIAPRVRALALSRIDGDLAPL